MKKSPAFLCPDRHEVEDWVLGYCWCSSCAEFFHCDKLVLNDTKTESDNSMKPETKYLVVNVRKSDGQTFFPDNPRHRKGIDNYSDAVQIANRKARENSSDYLYVVYRCEPVVSVELDNPPTKVTFY